MPDRSVRHDGARRVARTSRVEDRSSPTGARRRRSPVDATAAIASGASYTVVARRYRPQRFEDVVGQDHVVRALRNAIRLNRIAQAYLFCGTRGVGKTSMARIFAKCLNCVKGPTEEPCQVCDICQAIASGQDVDVIEIDGASNNGVEQVRELRQNAALRPSRARYKIYYIDEVHMLSTGAFNALLKTLEEPPPHVKFFFATTEANKIPITVLSRCQRYDFAGITPEVIARTLGEICAQEGVAAEPEALQVVARRAGGSLRDAQSLLDRLLASGSPRLTVEVVHGLLGTASDERLLAMLEALADHDAAAALRPARAERRRGRPAGRAARRAHRLPPRCHGAGRRRRVDAAGGLAAAAAAARSASSSGGRSTRSWRRCRSCPSAGPGCAAACTGGCCVEMALVRVARLEDLTALGTLVERLAALESGAAAAQSRRPAPRQENAEPQANPAAAGRGRLPRSTPAPAVRQAGRADVASAGPSDRGPRRCRTPPSPIATAPRQRSVIEPPPTAADGHRRRPRSTASGADGRATPMRCCRCSGRPAGELRAIAHGRRRRRRFDLATVRKVWPDLVKKVGAQLAWHLSQVEPVAVDGPGRPGHRRQAGIQFGCDECGTRRVPGENRAGAAAADPPAGDRQVRARRPTADDGASDARQTDAAAGRCLGVRPAGPEGRRAVRGPSGPDWITTSRTRSPEPEPARVCRPERARRSTLRRRLTRRFVARNSQRLTVKKEIVFNQLGMLAELMRNAGKLRESFEKAFESLGQLEVEGDAGGGAVTVKVNGRLEVVSVRIDPKLVADGDAELLEDLVAAAVNAGAGQGPRGGGQVAALDDRRSAARPVPRPGRCAAGPGGEGPLTMAGLRLLGGRRSTDHRPGTAARHRRQVRRAAGPSPAAGARPKRRSSWPRRSAPPRSRSGIARSASTSPRPTSRSAPSAATPAAIRRPSASSSNRAT